MGTPSGIWNFSKNKTAAKELNVYLSARYLFKERCRAVEGFDIPLLQSMSDSTVWDDVGPPKGVLPDPPLAWQHAARARLARPARNRRADRQPCDHAEYAGEAL